MRAFRRGLAAVAAAVLAAAGTAAALEGETKAKATVEDLAWLAGNWVHGEGDEAFHETWLPPAGGSLVGASRDVSHGKTTLVELSTIETAADGALVLYIRHFGAGLVPWKSEAAGPVRMPLASSKKGEAVFEDPERDFPKRLTYRAGKGDTLEALLEGTRGGAPMNMEFRFRRAK
jgi:hypothetical protein